MPVLGRRGKSTPEYDWDPERSVVVRNETDDNILLDLPTGYFRLDAGYSYRMTPDIAQIPQVRELLAAGKISISQ
jgi:hypothetical protein